jgi:PAS domain S-box-containing protein
MNTERIKVLYVDDEEGNLLAFRAGFRREFDVTTAKSGSEALDLLERESPHVVVSDQRMPHMNGTEFLARVRERWPRIVRIMLTGFSDMESVVDAVNRGGIHAYITKPWDEVDLRLRIQQAYEMHALKEERERLFLRYQQVFASSSDPILIVEANGRFHDANPAAEKLFGLTRDELLAQTSQAFVVDQPRLTADLLAKRRGSGPVDIEIGLRMTDGRVLDCLLTSTWLRSDGGSQGLFQAVLKDITDRKQEAVRLKELNRQLDQRVAVRTKQLKEALEDLNSFSFSVAHDLRSPLKSLKSMADHLSILSVMNVDPEMRQVADRMNHGLSRLMLLVDDLLRFARTDNHAIARENVDLALTAQECFNEVERDGRDIALILPDIGEAVIPMDPAMLRVALTNLLGNAVKFTRTRAEAVIEVQHEVVYDHHIITIKDNGVGFEPAKGSQLFGVFKRLHRAEEFEGTGIGLAIVQRVVQKHGGSCWAEGKLDGGASVHLRIPAAAVEGGLRIAM